MHFRSGLAVVGFAAGVVAVAPLAPSGQGLAQERVRPGVYKPGNGVTDPVLITKVEPKYRTEAMRAGIQGQVWLDAVVQPDGSVADIVVRKSLDATFGLDDEAIAAARQWTFRPSRLNGEPVAVEVTLILEFRLIAPARGSRDDRVFPRAPDSDARFLEGTVKVAASGVVAPVLLRSVTPPYPPEAHQQGATGIVRIEAVVDANGRVARVRPVGPEQPLLDEAALAAALDHAFRPGSVSGAPVAVVILIEIQFR